MLTTQTSSLRRNLALGALSLLASLLLAAVARGEETQQQRCDERNYQANWHSAHYWVAEAIGAHQEACVAIRRVPGRQAQLDPEHLFSKQSCDDALALDTPSNRVIIEHRDLALTHKNSLEYRYCVEAGFLKP